MAELGTDQTDSRAVEERVLQLCARPTPTDAQQALLTQLLAEPISWVRVLARAEQEGLGALLYPHLKGQAKVPRDTLRDTQAMMIRHKALFRGRQAVLELTLKALREAGLRSLLLKGSAVSLVAYQEPHLRCMRDLDLLVVSDEAKRAAEALSQVGFRCPHEDWDDHYHLASRDIEYNGVTHSLELHRKVQWELPWTLEERWADSMQVQVGAETARTLGPIDTLWLAYVHGFALSMEKSEGFRLIWVADMHALVERFVDELDFALVRERHPRLWNALPWFGVMSPWSEHVIERLKLPVLTPASAEETLPLSAWRHKSAWARGVKAPLAWAAIRHGFEADAEPVWITRARQAWVARTDS